MIMIMITIQSISYNASLKYEINYYVLFNKYL